MEHLLTVKEYKRMADEYDKVKYKCKCGHRVVIKHNQTKAMCSWCGSYVFKDNQEEFKYRISEQIKKRVR